MFKQTLDNISERRFYGRLLQIFQPIIRLSTIEWAEEYRVMSSLESSITGKFDCSRTPAFEYLYNLCDNWYIHIVGCMKSSQIGASEMENNVIGKIMHLNPCNGVVFFPGTSLLKEYSRKRFKPFFEGCKALADRCNIGIAKPAHDYFTFIGGSLGLKTLGSIQSVLSSPIPLIILEEFAQVKTEVAKQGDPLGLVLGRQKSFAIGMKKVLGFSTPTFKDFCNMEKLYNKGNKLIFKAKCHCCDELIELSGWTMDEFIKYDEYQDRYIDETYGKFNPESAYFACLNCKQPWTFEEKTQNILAGKNYGFIDDCGDFTYGWHEQKPTKEYLTLQEYELRLSSIDKAELRRQLKEGKKTLIYTLQYPEILSCFSATSNAEVLAIKKILAEKALEKGDETLAKDWANNSKGLPYTSGITSMDEEEMKSLRKNYPEHIVPMEGLELTMGVDVQDNRFAIVIRAWGRNNNSWLVTWKEIFGDVKVQEQDETGKFLGVWGELEDVIKGLIPHAAGRSLPLEAVSIDSADNTQLVYNFVLKMNETHPFVFAVKGVRDLRYSENEIYMEPNMIDAAEQQKRLRKTLAETMGVTVFNLGAHRAHEEILSRISLNRKPDAKSNLYYFNEQSYGQYEAQMTSCRKLIDAESSYNKFVYKLVPGKRKEAMDGEKLALHASYALGIRMYSNDKWREKEQYLYN